MVSKSVSSSVLFNTFFLGSTDISVVSPCPAMSVSILVLVPASYTLGRVTHRHSKNESQICYPGFISFSKSENHMLVHICWCVKNEV